jgi:hypothetical protein
VDAEREHDARTGRPSVGPFEAVASLTDRELEEELLIAASAPDHLRADRFERLLRERERRRRREELVLVIVSGPLELRDSFAGELARLLGAAYLPLDAVRAGLGPETEAARPVLGSVVDVNLRSRISVVVEVEGGADVDEALRPVRRNNPDVPVVDVEARDEASLSVNRWADEIWDRARGELDI